jgi:hypothetical protein
MDEPAHRGQHDPVAYGGTAELERREQPLQIDRLSHSGSKP